MLKNLINRFRISESTDSPIETLIGELSPRANDIEIKDGMQKLLDAMPKAFNKRIRYMTSEYRSGFLDMYDIVQYFYKRQTKYNLNLALEEAKKKYFEMYSLNKSYAELIDKADAKSEEITESFKKKEDSYKKQIADLENKLKQFYNSKIPKDIQNQINVCKTVSNSQLPDKEKIKLIRFYSKDWK